MPTLRSFTTTALLQAARLFLQGSRFFTAVAAGICDVGTLLQTIQKNWDDATFFRESPAIVAGLMEIEKQFIDRLPSKARVGLVGCGGGREIIPLLRLGFEVDGADLAPKAVDCARHHLAKMGLSAKIYCADIAEFVFPGESYDAFIFSWYTYGYIPTAVRRIRALKNLQSKLSDKGCVILTFNTRISQGPSLATRVARAMARLTGNSYCPEPGDSFGYDLSYEHFFTRDEIVAEARLAQFGLADYRDGTEGVAVLRPTQ